MYLLLSLGLAFGFGLLHLIMHNLLLLLYYVHVTKTVLMF